MIKAKLAAQAVQLTADRLPFVLATVVRARRPTSVRPGDTAIVRSDGAIEGFVGGHCAASSVRLYAMRALETGEPILLRLLPDGGDTERPRDGIEGVVVEHNPCLSGGALEIFLEPRLPEPRIVIVGDSPVAQALEELAVTGGYSVEPSGAASDGDLAGAAAVIVASHGDQEEQVLTAALSAGVPYVALVASRDRGAAVRAGLDLPRELSSQLHTPAGIDIGAGTPVEIAISILAELILVRHSDPAPGRPPATTAIDPSCGMEVAVTDLTLRVELSGAPIYFCSEGCRSAYASAHAIDVAKR
jgi:xanthine dehydrogenase accessory factor